MELKKLGEFGLIELITKQAAGTHPSIIKGISDDAAVINTDSKQCQLITTDLLQEEIHFKLEHTTPYLLGKKSLAVNLSDMAAMGASPSHYLVGLSLPSSVSVEFVKNFYRGMTRQAKQFNCYLVGGDTISSQDRILISITLLGSAEKNCVVYRYGAKKGDLIFVSGCLGDSHLGLLMLNKNKGQCTINPLVRKHLDPVPRVKEGMEISRLKIATSMIDISDGLISDLRHILKQSRAGAEIYLSRLPLSTMYKKYCPDFSKDFYLPALSGGEDYELLFTIPPEKRFRLEKMSKQTGLPVTCIGEITGNKLELLVKDKAGKQICLKNEGFNHF